jgi:hypothetical protein
MSSEIIVTAESPAVNLTADPDTLALDAIPAYVKAIGRKMATDAWLVGKALARAKKLVQGSHRAGCREDGWRKWCQSNIGCSHETARKWIKVTEHISTKEPLEGLTLEEAYYASGGKKARRPKTPNASKEKSKPSEHNPGAPSLGDDDEGRGDTCGSKAPVHNPRATETLTQESDEGDSKDEVEDPGDMGVISPDVEDLLATSFHRLHAVQRATTLANAIEAANSLHACLVGLADVLHLAVSVRQTPWLL